MFGCCVIVGILNASPRIVMAALWLFTGYIDRAYSSILWPLLGLIFLPCTAMAYAIAQNELGGAHGWGLIVLIGGVILDMAIYGSDRARSMRDSHWGPDHTHPGASGGGAGMDASV
jgi:hypothetical protein